MRRATGYKCPQSTGNLAISIHALHEESDDTIMDAIIPTIFQSTLSMRRATARRTEGEMTMGNFNPRSP